MATLKVYRRKKKCETVEQQLDSKAKHILQLRKADETARKKRKNTWVVRLKKRVQRVLKSRHSPAGKKYLRSK